MKKTFLIFCFAASAAFPAFRAAAASEDGDMLAVMRGMFLSQSGEHALAARVFADAAGKLHNAPLMGEAFRESLSAKAPQESLRYARRWRKLGGGAEAALAEARALLALGRFGEATEILAELKQNGLQKDEELAKFLRFAPRNQIAALGRALFDDTAAGNLLLAKLAAAAGDYPAASNAVEQGLSKPDAAAELRMLKARIAGQKSPRGALAVLSEYKSRRCPGISSGCAERALLYAYALYARGDENWRRALDHPEEEKYKAAAAAGEFLERAEFPGRARVHYEQAGGMVFRAVLGLARIARDAGQLKKALAILDNAKAADDSEFALREATAADVEKRLNGAESALKRIRHARTTSPDNFDLMYHESLLAEESGDVGGAVALLERAVELFPNDASGWNALGYVLADHNMRLAEAEVYIKRALALDPDSANILDSLGWVYYRRGKLEEALRYLIAAARRSDSAEIAAHLGEVYWFLGERGKARAVFSRALERAPDDKVLNETIRRLQIGN